MAAFDRISSGLPGLDRILDSIRIGDNVVWQVSSVDEYRLVARIFAARAVADGRKLIYVRFAPHAEILCEEDGARVVVLDPSAGFENFTGALHHIIAEAGTEAFYVFDSLSELQTAWAADLMMGNFFNVTCPYLFELDTVAWFCLLRNRHSYDTIARIRETTQLLLDLYPDDDCLYVHPVKVWQRYSPSMFFPHRICPSRPDEVVPVTDGVSVSRFYELVAPLSGTGAAQSLDSWERFFISAREETVRLDAFAPSVSEGLVREMAERLVGADPRFLDLMLRFFTARDLLEIKDRMIGSGKIGGKSAGMVTARKIVARKLPVVVPRIEPHDSFFVGSDVFYTYLVYNKLWKQRILQRTGEGYYSAAPALRDGILAGSFPDAIRAQFIRALEYFGQSPIIVRSSSLLEDSFGHAFAGKYESVFCVNAGSPEDRLLAFENAMRAVYASTMDESALSYRSLRGLTSLDEQMAILVQRVSGSLFGSFLMPAMAGVGYSFSSWRWNREIDPEAGMLRLVAGLGTRAVDRTGSDYPRLVSLDRPLLDPAGTTDRAKYCQRSVDVLDLAENKILTRSLDEIALSLPAWLVALLAERDIDAERYLSEKGTPRQVLIGTCAGAVSRSDLLADIGSMMASLQRAYTCPVDIEFTVNWAPTGEYRVNLLQCRPLQGAFQNSDVAGANPGAGAAGLDDETLAAIDSGKTIFVLDRDVMGPPVRIKLDAVIVIDPLAYYTLPFRDKPTVARIVGELNGRYGGSGLESILLSPGRLGTSSPELGLPVRFAEIDRFRALCEVEFSEAGYQPELSFGSHFFQDLVETGICYAAIPEAAWKTADLFFARNALNLPDRFREIFPASTLPDGLICVYETSELYFVSDAVRGRCLCAREGAKG